MKLYTELMHARRLGSGPVAFQVTYGETNQDGMYDSTGPLHLLSQQNFDVLGCPSESLY